MPLPSSKIALDKPARPLRRDHRRRRHLGAVSPAPAARHRALGARGRPGDGVGGTWFWNRYPGARCDIESMTTPTRGRTSSSRSGRGRSATPGRPRSCATSNHVADRFDLRRDIRLGTRVVEAEPSTRRGDRWSIATDGGERFAARFLIMATGCLSVPRIPDIPGIERFAGEMHHTGLWPHEGVDFAGKRVGVIGTGSSAVQAIPVIAGQAAQLTVFQRTANFSVPGLERAARRRRPASARRATRCSAARRARPRAGQPVERARAGRLGRDSRGARARVRGALRGRRVLPPRRLQRPLHRCRGQRAACASSCASKIRERVHDPEVAELLCPYDHPLGTKRCASTPTTSRPTTAPTSRLGRSARRRSRRSRRRACASATSEFDARHDRARDRLRRDDRARCSRSTSRGRGGLSLREKWADGPRTYLGLTIGGLPEPVHRDRSGQPVGAQQHDGLDRAARRLDRRLHRATCASTDSRRSRRPPRRRTPGWSTSARSATRASSRAPTRGTWARTSPASRACCCPTSAGSASIARSATPSPRAATTGSSWAIRPVGGVDDSRRAAPSERLPREFEAIFESVKNWGRWGAEDVRGTLNLITPEHVRRAASLVRTGRTCRWRSRSTPSPGPTTRARRSTT